MDKKNRTGLQSKISHIFAGVPVPKKKTPLSDNSESGKKDGIPDITQNVTDDLVLEQTVNDRKPVNSNLEDDITELSFSPEALEYPEQDLQQQQEPKKFQPKPLESFKKSPIDKQIEEELSQEQFKIISEPDITEKTERPENKSFKEKKTSDSESEAVKSDSSTLDNLLAQDKSKPVSLNKQPLVQKPSKDEIEEKKPRVKEVTPQPPVKGIIKEKSVITGSKNSVVKDTALTPKAIVSDVPGLKDATKQVTRIPRRTSLKTKGKNLNSKTADVQPRQKLMVALIIILPILLVLVLLKNYGFFESSSSTPVINPPVSTTSSAKVSGGSQINWQTPPVYPDDIRDPMGLVESGGGGSGGGSIFEYPDFDVSGTSALEGGEYQVSIIINKTSKMSLEKDAVIKDNKGREVKIIDVSRNQVIFEMGTVLWTYDVSPKKWTKYESKDTLGD